LLLLLALSACKGHLKAKALAEPTDETDMIPLD
jgi:hypothetical protein